VPDIVEVAFDAFGVALAVTAPADLEDAIRSVLPPGWRPVDPSTAVVRCEVRRYENGSLAVFAGDTILGTTDEETILRELLDNFFRQQVGARSPDRIFIHGGAVVVGTSAVVLPGRSFAGKTTLVSALVRRGALYLSDEYALLDEHGHVHPYARPLSVRRGTGGTTDLVDVAELGGLASEQPHRIALIVLAEYRPGAMWKPRRLSRGTGAMHLFSHTLTQRPEAALTSARAAAEAATIIEGERGEADQAAADIFALIAERAADDAQSSAS
jgi:hypothetical protein